MYVTSALQKSDMKAVSLQLALDILHRKEDRDLVTGLRSRTNAGISHFNAGISHFNAGIPHFNAGIPHFNAGIPHLNAGISITL